MLRKWLGWAVVLWGASSALMAAPLQLGTDEWPPYEMVNEPQSPGFSVEVIRRVFENMGVPAEIHQYPWARAQSMAFAGQNDGLFSAFRNAERSARCYYPDEPLAVDRWVLFVRKDNVNRLAFHSLDDLKDRLVGVVRGAAVSPEFWAFVKARHGYEESVDDDANFRKLLAGRVDYVVASEVNGARERFRIPDGEQIAELPGSVLKEDAMYLIFSKRTVSPQAVEAFSKAMSQFRVGSYAEYSSRPGVAPWMPRVFSVFLPNWISSRSNRGACCLLRLNIPLTMTPFRTPCLT
ncbi:ABC transporter substrate-binding protein [Chromobacterium sp. IIBBL 290-4]|uniref:substrate-binding periplasmic protein n=1 Tax=Chromobacterium sp. IIBBL 290-4 TaxID=2953890 RepID=UPI0020B823B3|nr:transporter substrate-binding domain-containing protein [Chromobacterium sp. IIBBL 290-4]UTH73415.1 transporter substrate-binding domain-containing protein [Chromobacterium sp. IIBBL 290-4]